MHDCFNFNVWEFDIRNIYSVSYSYFGGCVRLDASSCLSCDFVTWSHLFQLALTFTTTVPVCLWLNNKSWCVCSLLSLNGSQHLTLFLTEHLGYGNKRNYLTKMSILLSSTSYKNHIEKWVGYVCCTDIDIEAWRANKNNCANTHLSFTDGVTTEKVPWGA